MVGYEMFYITQSQEFKYDAHEFYVAMRIKTHIMLTSDISVIAHFQFFQNNTRQALHSWLGLIKLR